MSSLLIVSILFCFGIYSTLGTSISTCRANEYFATCASPCQATCTNRKPTTCVTSCSARCVCSAGYVRDTQRANSPCVLPQQCSNAYPTCRGANERYLTCGQPCQASCTVRNPPCQRNCVSGCFCRQGYVRNSNNVCVLPQSCPSASPTKAGRCPPTPIVTGSYINCVNDYNCRGNQKCCSQSPAGRKVCSGAVFS